jgi:ZIP family zinc transporter
MDLASTTLLGFIAGVTILVGLPLGRVRTAAPALRMVLNGVAVGILVFLVWDVLSASWEPIDDALSSVHEGHGGTATAVGYGLLALVGLSVGLLTLVAYERWTARPAPSAQARPFGPGAMTVGELASRRGGSARSPGRRLALLIAVGIGLHNFAEGLAIGQSAASDEIGLALMLVIGFGLHNATEGFGIVAPLAADIEGGALRPSWAFLLLLGAIGGGPTVVGTVLGHGFTSQPISVAFLTLAAGSLLYVIVQLIGVAARARRTDLLAFGLLLGMVAGFVTDGVVTAAGV